MENKHTISDLYQMQSLPLSAKLRMTEYRIQQWIDEYGSDGVYISFSGGKDSTVLLDIIRNRMGYRDIQAVFFDTGLEYPELRDFVSKFDNVEWLRPKINFKQTIEKYGYPFISKEVSESVYGSVEYLNSILYQYPELKIKEGKQISKCLDNEALAEILNDRITNKKGGANQRLAIMLGWLSNNKERLIDCHIDDEKKSIFTQDRYKFLLDAPFSISNKCCDIMKKYPSHDYTKRTGKKPITAQMAAESRLRQQKWLKNGCNGFQMKRPISNPMSFWTEQDVLKYILQNNIEICSVYGEIIENEESDGQITLFNDPGIESLKYETTGCSRTGCIFCGYACHHEKSPTRFEQLSYTHPKQFDYLMRGGSIVNGIWKPDNRGLGYWFVILWINYAGNLKIVAPHIDEYRSKYSDSETEELLEIAINIGKSCRKGGKKNGKRSK